MGAKFCNLNIYGGDPEAVRAACSGLHVCQAVPRWITVTGGTLSWGTTQSAARILSKALGCPVLSTEYFDDDYVEFAIWLHGKRLTHHVPAAYEDFPRKKGNAKVFLETFGLSPLDEKPFKQALAEEDPEESVRLMEAFLGCPMFGVKADCPPDGAPDTAPADRLRGGKSPVEVRLSPNPARADQPPYLGAPGVPEPSWNQLCYGVLCFTEDTKALLRRLRNACNRFEDQEKAMDEAAFLADWTRACLRQQVPFPAGHPVTEADAAHAERAAKEAAKAAYYLSHETFDLRAVPFSQGLLLQNYPPISGAEDSKFFRCLTVSYLYDLSRTHLALQMGYGGKTLCWGARGAVLPGENAVLEDIILSSPWLTLPSGALKDAFEQPTVPEAIRALEALLGSSLSPITPKTHELAEGYGSLHLFRRRV